MDGSPNIAKIGALLGDNARARMLATLMHGKALTASELAREAGITAQTASSHLAKLEAGGLLAYRKQGRHKYFALASGEIAALLETLMGLSASNEPIRTLTGPRDTAMRKARVCYNHLAGDKGIRMYDSLIERQLLVQTNGNLALSRNGEKFVRGLDIDLDVLKSSRSPLCRECLDWSERRSHLAGTLGRSLLTQFEKLRWVTRDNHSRIIRFSARGEAAFDAVFETSSAD